MPNGPRPSHVFIKERISLNIARLKKGGQNFEIVLKDPDKALEFKQGKEIDMREILETPKVFKDAKKGELQSSEMMKKWLETEKPLEAAKIILRKGEVSLTAEQRKAMFEVKRKKIIDYIRMNAGDPKTGLPHPVTRIELAMKEVKVQIDPYKSVDAQIDDVIKQLQPVLPLSLEKMRIRVIIPAKYAGPAYGNLKSRFDLRKDEWKNDGSVQFELEAPVGIKPDVYNLINKLTNGEAQIEEITERK